MKIANKIFIIVDGFSTGQYLAPLQQPRSKLRNNLSVIYLFSNDPNYLPQHEEIVKLPSFHSMTIRDPGGFISFVGCAASINFVHPNAEQIKKDIEFVRAHEST